MLWVDMLSLTPNLRGHEGSLGRKILTTLNDNLRWKNMKKHISNIRYMAVSVHPSTM